MPPLGLRLGCGDSVWEIVETEVVELCRDANRGRMSPARKV